MSRPCPECAGVGRVWPPERMMSLTSVCEGACTVPGPPRPPAAITPGAGEDA